MPGKDIEQKEAREASGIDNMNLDAAIINAVISFEVGITDFNTLHNESRDYSSIHREF
jgi:hypothetical protein